MTPDTSIIIKGLAPLVKPSANWLGKKIIGEEILERRQLEATALQPVLRQAAEDIAETIEAIGAAEIDQICLFLTSNEAEAIVRQIYAASILKSKEQNLEQIEQEFLKAFSLYTDIPETDLQDAAPQIFRTLVTGCEKALKIAIDEGRLSAHEARSSFRHQVLLDEIANIQKNLEFLSASRQLNTKAVLKFEQQYRQQVKELHGKLTPPYIDVAKKLPIDELYVCPNFSPEIINRDPREKPKSQPEFYQSLYRTVLLGNPGGGKSTCSQKFCYDLVTQYSDRLLGGRQVTPILVILRDYGVKKKEINCSLLEFIELTAKTKYQLQPPDGAFEYLLLNGHLAIAFDGLDELTETSYRQEISNDVELFCNLYPAVPVLVTSREVGYKEAPLNESKFEVYRLAPFDDPQVKEYVTKWFAIDRELTPEQQQEKVKAFLEESQNLTDLRSNPLMLGLMCNIYKGEGYIPRNRPDVYAKCAEMLFERWDRGRGIKLPSLVKEIESKIKPLMMYLAHWIYTDETLQSGVSERKLIDKAADYLCEKRFDDRDDAEGAAKAFIRFCRGRAWVFTNVGTNKNNEELYKFTHRTFLEYFTAAYLNRIHRTPDKLFEILLPRIAKQEWDVVCQLAFQIQNTKFEDAGDELLTCLLEEINQFDNKSSINLVLFAAKCLEFIIPSPKITQRIIDTGINKLLKLELSRFTSVKHIESFNTHDNNDMRQLLSVLYKANQENIKVIRFAFQSLIEDKLIQDEYREGALALELIYIIHEKILSQETKYLLYKKNEQKFKMLAQQDLLISNLYHDKYNYSLSQIIKWHSLGSVFQNCYFRLFPMRVRANIAYVVIGNMLNDLNLDNTQKINDVLKDLSFLNQIIFNAENHVVFPINILVDRFHNSFSLTRIFMGIAVPSRRQSNFISLSKLANFNKNIVFGYYILFACLLEIEDDFDKDQFSELTKTIQGSIFSFLLYVCLARIDDIGKYDHEVQAELDKCNFNQEQRDFIWKWVRREINLVAITDSEEEH